MDYILILKDYPKGMDAFCMVKFGGDVEKCMGANEEHKEQFLAALSLINDRDLYDFFDSHGIYCYPDPCTCHNPPLWNWCILQHSKEVFIAEDEHTTRTESDTASFMKAWELLEPTL